jgi:hypothetical protein
MQRTEAALKQQRGHIELLSAYLRPSELEAVARASVFAGPFTADGAPLWAAVAGSSTNICSSSRHAMVLTPAVMTSRSIRTRLLVGLLCPRLLSVRLLLATLVRMAS